MKRLLWLDVAKGLAILVVVYFHFFRAYFEHGSLPPADWNGFAASVAQTFIGPMTREFLHLPRGEQENRFAFIVDIGIRCNHK